MVKIILFQPDIAQNLGTAMRLCTCFGVDLEIIEPCGFPLTAKALRRTAMDYGHAENIKRHVNWSAYEKSRKSELIEPSKDINSASIASHSRLILFTTKAATPLPDFGFRPTDHLLFGRESAGVPEEVHTSADARVIIPLAPEARSFNLAISASIALYEALRQTGQLPPDQLLKA